MKLWGQISVELTVADYVEAAEHQLRMQDLLKQVRGVYPEATFSMRERRVRGPQPNVRPAPPRDRGRPVS